MTNESLSTNAAQLGLILRRRAATVALCVVAGGLIGLIYSLSAPKEYTGTASVVFNNNEQGQQAAGLQAVVSPDPALVQNTNVALLSVGDMAGLTARAVGHGLSKSSVAQSINITPEANTTVVDLSATSRSPQLAARIANTYSSIFVNQQQTASQQYYRQALATVDNQLRRLSKSELAGAQGVVLEQRAQALSTLSEIHDGNVQVAQSASVPTSPSSPRKTRNLAIGLFVGLLVGLVAGGIRERLDQRLREPEELAAAYGLPLLGSVPESNGFQRPLQQDALEAREANVFQLLRAHLQYFNVDRELRTLLIASATAGDGKTTVACQLAVAAARHDSRVLLIETDVRRPTLVERFQAEPGPGLADVLIGNATLSTARQTMHVDVAGLGGTDVREVDVLLAGKVLPPNPTELLESHAMEELLAEAHGAYDLTILDTAPLTVVPDALSLLQKVDGVVIVGRLGKHRRDIAHRLSRTLAPMHAPLLGVIANGAKPGGAEGYAYYGNYYSTEPSGRQKSAEAVSGPQSRT